MMQLNEYLAEQFLMPFPGEAGEGAILEGIMNPEDDAIQAVEVDSLLKKHYCHTGLKSHKWIGSQLQLIYDGYGYLYEFNDLAKDLGCKRFKVYPQAIIRETPVLDNVHLEVATRIQISDCKITNCSFEDGCFPGTGRMGCYVGADKSGNLTIKDSTFNVKHLVLRNVTKAQLSGNDFSQVESLALTGVGPLIQRIVEKWNICTIDKNSFTSYPRPKGEFNPNIDPIKLLGLDKHFKNLNRLAIALGTSGNNNYILYTKDTTYKKFDWGVDTYQEMSNGWKMLLMRDARCL